MKNFFLQRSTITADQRAELYQDLERMVLDGLDEEDDAWLVCELPQKLAALNQANPDIFEHPSQALSERIAQQNTRLIRYEDVNPAPFVVQLFELEAIEFLEAACSDSNPYPFKLVNKDAITQSPLFLLYDSVLAAYQEGDQDRVKSLLAILTTLSIDSITAKPRLSFHLAWSSSEALKQEILKRIRHEFQASVERLCDADTEGSLSFWSALLNTLPSAIIPHEGVLHEVLGQIRFVDDDLRCLTVTQYLSSFATFKGELFVQLIAWGLPVGVDQSNEIMSLLGKEQWDLIASIFGALRGRPQSILFVATLMKGSRCLEAFFAWCVEMKNEAVVLLLLGSDFNKLLLENLIVKNQNNVVVLVQLLILLMNAKRMLENYYLQLKSHELITKICDVIWDRKDVNALWALFKVEHDSNVLEDMVAEMIDPLNSFVQMQATSRRPSDLACAEQLSHMIEAASLPAALPLSWFAHVAQMPADRATDHLWMYKAVVAENWDHVILLLTLQATSYDLAKLQSFVQERCQDPLVWARLNPALDLAQAEQRASMRVSQAFSKAYRRASGQRTDSLSSSKSSLFSKELSDSDLDLDLDDESAIFPNLRGSWV